MSALAAVDHEPTAASLWQAVSGRPMGDELLEWPPDLFAMTDLILERSEAYRFALSPPGGVAWPPARTPVWADEVVDAGRRWGAWVEHPDAELPGLLAEEWEVFQQAANIPIARLREAHDWHLCGTLLTLHAIADEACAGLGVALDACSEEGLIYRARARELLASTGSLARIPSHFVRVLPKVRTPPNGTSMRSLSRYASVHSPGVDARWHKLPDNLSGSRPHDKTVNYLLLPWPLRVRESDFRPVPASVHAPAKEPFGFFEFAPSEGLDLGFVDRMLIAALDEVDGVNVVILPESAVDEADIEDLETLLDAHHVKGLITGVRQRVEQPGQFPRNWVHISVSTGEHRVQIRQSKHHRWSLDEGQIDQYHLGGALHPHIRWWEAMEVPRRSVQFLDFGARGTLVSLVCEDLAQIDDVADVVRSVGPTIVVTPLLDGPQLSSRWAARYASVLADDPGSAVLTLTSLGMARRSRPPGEDASAVVALWKGPGQGTREIALEAGAEGVLLSASLDRATRRSFDGRRPIDSGSELFNMSVYQVRAASPGSGPTDRRTGPPARHMLDARELTILTSWAEAIAEALTSTAERLGATLADADAGAPWRAELGVGEPSEQLSQVISAMSRAVRTAIAARGSGAADALREDQPHERGIEKLIHQVLRSAIEQRLTQAADRDGLVAVVAAPEAPSPTLASSAP